MTRARTWEFHSSNIEWITIEPLSKARLRDDHDDVEPEPKPVPNAVWNTKVPVRKGDTVALIYRDRRAFLTEPVQGGTLRSLFAAIERGMKRKLDPRDWDTKEKAYVLISRFVGDKKRLELVHAFEKGKLAVKDLVGDHYFFEGPFVRSKDGVWEYGLGS